MELTGLFNLQFLMFAEMFAGYILCRIGVIKAKERSLLSHLVINLLLPCSIISSFDMELSSSLLFNLLQIFLIALAIMVICSVLAGILYRRIPEDKRGVLQYATVVSNAGFLGNAVAEGVYGALGMVYCQIYLVPQRIVMWTAGVTYLAPKTNHHGAVLKLLRHPCMVATYIGLIRLLLQLPFPYVIDNTIKTLGKCSSPTVMLFLGMTLAEAGLKTIFTKLNLVYCLVRLVLIPGIVLGICLLIRPDPIVAGIAILLAAMPAGSTTAILAEEYGADSSFAADCVVLSTLLSIAILPVWAMITHFFF